MIASLLPFPPPSHFLLAISTQLNNMSTRQASVSSSLLPSLLSFSSVPVPAPSVVDGGQDEEEEKEEADPAAGAEVARTGGGGGKGGCASEGGNEGGSRLLLPPLLLGLGLLVVVGGGAGGRLAWTIGMGRRRLPHTRRRRRVVVRSTKLLLHAFLLLLLLLLAKAPVMLPAPVFVKEGGREGGMRARLRLQALAQSHRVIGGAAKSLTTRVLAPNNLRQPHYPRTKICPSSACLACVWGCRKP